MGLSFSLVSSSEFLYVLISPKLYNGNVQNESRRRIMTFILYNTPLLSIMRDTISQPTHSHIMGCILDRFVEFNPPYEYPPSWLIEKYHKNNTPIYLTRPALIRMIVVELLTLPFLLDNISTSIKSLTVNLLLKDVLLTISSLFHDNTTKLDDMAVAGLLINITALADIESGKHLDGLLVKCCMIYFYEFFTDVVSYRHIIQQQFSYC